MQGIHKNPSLIMNRSATETIDRMQSYLEFKRRKTELQRLHRAKLKEHDAVLNPHKTTRKYSKRRPTKEPKPVESSQYLTLSTIKPTERDIDYLLVQDETAEGSDTYVPQVILHEGFTAERELEEEEAEEEVRQADIDQQSIQLHIDLTEPPETEELQVIIGQSPCKLTTEEEEVDETGGVFAVAADQEDYVVDEYNPPTAFVETPDPGQVVDDSEWPIDEEQELFFQKRDQILRLCDQLDKEDRLELMTEVEFILRDGVRKRLARIRLM